MRLKTLEIQGYKSFAVKTRFDFDQGITAVVGPNGSGKSNISDAIRWVLGEQSYSSLRGQKTADMIFSGSTARARLGMASVSLILDNSDGSLPLDYNEVTISRRAYRSGENEYLINNNRVRLKDVAEVLARGGLARQTYTSIGQGTIDRALSLRAEERRQLFEEAAGIVYHRQRRAETLRRLDETHSNLLRVNDIVKEIEPRLSRLKKQAEKVEMFQKISLHLQGLLKVWYGYRWGQKQHALREATMRAAINEEKLQQAQAGLAQIEEKIQAARTRQIEIRGEVGRWHAESSKLHTQAETLQRELAVGEERARQLASQREELLSEAEGLKQRMTEQQERVNQAQAALDEINQNYQQAQNQLKAAQKNLDTFQQERQTLLHRQEQAQAQVERAAHRITDRQSRLEQLAERLHDLQQQQQTHADKLASLRKQQDAARQSLAEAEQQAQELADQVTSLDNQADDLRRQQQSLAETAQSLAGKIANKEKSLASLQARLDLLEKLRVDMSGYHQGVKEVLQAKSLKGVKGTLAQLMRVPGNLETALEMAVGGQLQNVVVENWRHAEAAIEHLKSRRAGRATFLPLDRIRPPRRVDVPAIDGVLGLATDLVSFSPDVAPAVESALNRLLIVQDLAVARQALDALKGSFQIATLSGEVVRSGGSVTGGRSKGKQSQGGILSREREYRELPAQIKAIQADIEQFKAELQQTQAGQNRLEADRQTLLQQQQSAANAQNAHRAEVNRRQKTLSDLQNQLAWTEERKLETSREMESLATRRVETEAVMEQLRAEKTAAEQSLAELTEKLSALSAETLLNEFNQAKTQVSLAQQRMQTQKELLQTYRQSLNQTRTESENRHQRITRLAQQRQSLLDRLDIQRQEHKTLVEAVKTYTDKIDPAEAQLKQLEQQQAAAEAAESKHRVILRRVESDANRATLDVARCQDEIDALQRQIEDDFGLVKLSISDEQIAQPVLPLHTLVTQLPTVETLPEGIETDIRHLKVQLRQLGRINPDAPQEYTELKERYDFLTSQMADLETASADLKQVIGELDKIIEEAFTQTFVAVAKEFQKYFKILFNGGEAQLILTDPDDIAHTGVNIIARPPGKRAQSLELLSGGERSLTAQSLIFALLKTSPTPYCVFDEVDAMLDEANVDRFRQALATLGEDIQFIIITHNRKTIEIADTVYGISIGNDAVSRVVSLKLEDAASEEEEPSAQAA